MQNVSNKTSASLLPALEEIHKQFSLAENHGIFGKIVVEAHETFKGETILPRTKRFQYSEDDNDATFMLGVTFHPPGLLDTLAFDFNENECFISSWWQANMDGDAKFNHRETVDHPFVLSWQRFLEKNGYDKTLDGYTGNANFEVLDFEDGFELLEKWLKWVKKFS